MFVCGFNKNFQLDQNSNNKNSAEEPIIDEAIKFQADESSFLSFSTNISQTVWITKEGNSYVRGNNENGIISSSLPKAILRKDTEFFLKDESGRRCKFISVLCGFIYTLYLVSDGSDVFRLVYCCRNKFPNPLFLNIGNRIPRALFGGSKTSGVIDSEGGIIIITDSVLESPTQKIETTFLPNGDKAVKLAFYCKFVISLGQSCQVYMSEISGKSPFKFSEVKELSGETVVDITGTHEHCFAVLNDGRVFGLGYNWNCRVGLPKKTKYVSTFTEIDSLKKYKIISAFAGSHHSIFKTLENKMIVCGDNSDGELFIPHKNCVYPPEEVRKFEGFSFCLAGFRASAAFLRIDPPPNVCNKKIGESNKKSAKQKNVIHRSKITPSISAARDDMSIHDEIQRLKTELSLIKASYAEELKKKDDEIQRLKKDLSQAKDLLKKLESENKQLKQEPMKDERKFSSGNGGFIKIISSEENSKIVEGKRIGKGATSEVIEAFRQEKLAKKILDVSVTRTTETAKTGSDDEYNDDCITVSIEQLKRFLQECEALNSLNHPNIIKTYGFFFGDELHAPAMYLEYCESNLKKRIKKLTNKERISAIVGLSSAMEKVHSVGIIHRDLKLENILLDSNNNVKLSDFGLCTFIKTDEETLSRTQMAGSLKYMAPELIQGRKDYDEKVDVYAFGVVVFLILTKGEYPEISIADVGAGKQAEIPSYITKFSSKLIRSCWSAKSRARPSFNEISNILNGNEDKLI